MWAVIQGVIFLILAAAAATLFGIAVRDRVRFLLIGQKDPTRTNNKRERAWSFVKNVLFQRKVLAEPSGLGHFFIFWGFLVLIFGDLDFVVYHLTNWHFPWGMSPAYLFLEELFSLCVLVAIVVGLVRRYVFRPMRIMQSFEAGFILCLIGMIVLTYLFATVIFKKRKYG